VKKKSSATENEILKVGKYQVKITNLDKILFPKPAITKGELIDYYYKIAPTMLPYLKDRLITMQRFPDGIEGESFFQKDAKEYFPEWIKTKVVAKEDGTTRYVIVNNAATLIYIVNLASIPIHRWLSTVKKLHYPDLIIFDLDPSGKDFNHVRHAALKLKNLLEDLGLVPFVMTTGSRGLHVVIPIKPQYDFDFVRKFSRDVSYELIALDPKHLTGEVRKENREGRIFVDYFRNGFGATGVCPYAVRPHPGAPVATPLVWKEVESKSLKSTTYTIKNIFKRLDRIGDPWKDMKKHARSITKPRKFLDKIMQEKITVKI
jgi:bifunctional non-homologous end joining protein LigD